MGHRLKSGSRGQLVAPRGVTFGNGRSEDEAVALCNNAAFLETPADLGVARTDVVQVK
jgi:hypothetical protein